MIVGFFFTLVLFNAGIQCSPNMQENIDYTTLKKHIIDTYSCITQKDCAQKKYLSTTEPLLHNSQFKLLIQEAKKEVPEAHEALKNIRQELKLRAVTISKQTNEYVQSVARLGMNSAIFLTGIGCLGLSTVFEDPIIRLISGAIGGIAAVASGFYIKKTYSNIELIDISIPQAVYTMNFAAAQIEQIQAKLALEKIL
jgi:hypothetical protein